MGQITGTTPTEEFNGKGVGTAFVGLQDQALDGKERKFFRVAAPLSDHQIAHIARAAKPPRRDPALGKIGGHYYR